jgi:predicted AAA+ superfamily ATPase
MDRFIDTKLIEWKKSRNRRVLLLRGARQVGKTYAVRVLGRTFENFLEINFEKNKNVHAFFEGDLDPKEINKKLAGYFGQQIQPGKTLLFLDEIQACLPALQLLRFYAEEMSSLHVIAAGSLLEIALSQIPSFGVGRLANLFMYPVTFSEFLRATNNRPLHQIILSASAKRPLDTILHQKALELFRSYLIVGGMPAVVQSYVDRNDYLVAQATLDDLIKTLIDDFAKYKKRAPVIKLEETFRSAGYQAGRKFMFSQITENSTANTHKEALDLLSLSGLVHKVYHSHARGIPLGAQIDTKKFKVVPLDVGLYHRLLGLKLSEFLLESTLQLINKGAAAEVFVGQELLAYSESTLNNQLYYWHRESPTSNAEVDYVIQEGSEIVPVEVKAGTKGQMQSLHIFLRERQIPLGLRISHENFSRAENFAVCPVYAVENFCRNGVRAILG